MTDPILRRLELLRGYVAFLRERQDNGLDELVEDPELEAAIERYFQKAIEACIDIADRIKVHEALGWLDDFDTFARAVAGHLQRVP